uniref:Uncharacterized protein n=1 Tax=Curvibacter symbiont subsp. Hydra magnipapillata TaxID=667019 RepID=C9YAJ5_CURXX|nr:hypothetical protein Csp_A11460 [Curvibacter putative symbiont of Hydra magnipapillata]
MAVGVALLQNQWRVTSSSLYLNRLQCFRQICAIFKSESLLNQKGQGVLNWRDDNAAREK